MLFSAEALCNYTFTLIFSAIITAMPLCLRITFENIFVRTRSINSYANTAPLESGEGKRGGREQDKNKSSTLLLLLFLTLPIPIPIPLLGFCWIWRRNSGDPRLPPMTASASASAAAAMLLYLVINRRCGSTREREEDEAGRWREESAERDRAVAEREEKERRRLRQKALRRPVRPAVTWGESMTMLGRTLRFAYKQTFGQWSVGDLICGVRHNMREEGNLEVASAYAGSNSVELQGPEILTKLTRLLRLLILCFSFTRDTFRVFVKSGGFTKEDVILKQLKAAFLKPSFTVLCDRNSKSFLLFIRGAISVKDKMTASYGPLVPFHHIILEEGDVSKLILGYAHCGMVVAARWAARHATPYLRKALTEHPEYDIKIIGHSMGAGIAALLTFILREQREFASTTCIAFGPASCMTWDLAASANHFITSIVNATDLVPTFEAVTVRNLRAEVGASSWIEQTRFLNAIHRNMISIKSIIPSSSSSSTRTRVRGANKFLKHVSHTTKVVIKHAQNTAKAVVKSGSSLASSWSCTARSRQARRNLDKEITPGSVIASESDSTVREWFSKKSVLDKLVRNSRVSDDAEIDDKINRVLAAASVEQMTEVQFWYMLEKELQRQDEDVQALKEAAAAAEIKEEKAILTRESLENELPLLPNGKEDLQFWPPGRMLHIVASPALDHKIGKNDLRDRSIGIYEVPRKMYGKIRLSQTMIKDHYMDRYQTMMELLIDKLKKENNDSATGVIQ